MASIAEVLTQVQELSRKFDVLNDSVVAHHALDIEKCKKIEQLYQDIHGDGNGKKGIRRELDAVVAFVETGKRVMWVTVGAAITSLIGALVTILVNTIV